MPGVTSLSLVSGYESDSSTSSTHHDAVVDEDLQVTAVTPAPTRLADPRAVGTAVTKTSKQLVTSNSGLSPGP